VLQEPPLSLCSSCASDEVAVYVPTALGLPDVKTNYNLASAIARLEPAVATVDNTLHLFGESGCGKTATLRVLAGLWPRPTTIPLRYHLGIAEVWA